MHRVLQSRVMPAAKGWRAPLIRRLGSFLRALYRCVAEPWLRRAAINELRRLSTRELRDVGIEPYEIDELVDGMLAKGRRDE
jgi:uncharacterized protein YjiS (DUF1127 family)